MLRKIKLISILLLLLGCVSLFYFLPRMIVINEVECKSQYGFCSEELNMLSQSMVGKNYYKVKKELKESLLSNQIVSDYQLFYQPPAKIKLDVLIRKGVILFRSKETKSTFLVDENGYVISKIDTPNLGVIDVGSDLSLGEIISDEYKLAMNIFQKMAILEKIQSASLEEDGFYVKLENNPTVIFPNDGDTDVLVGSYVVTINELNSGEQNSRIDKDKNMIIIDLRFKNPVIK